MSASRTITIREPTCGLTAFIVIDSTFLGPAAGGVRTLPYPSEAAALADARRLARAMTVKCAISGLEAGGGKAVVMDHPQLDRTEAFKRLGEAVEALQGDFRTAGDAGTTARDLAVMAGASQYVHQDETGLAQAVADGLTACLSAACDFRGDLTWPNVTVAVQGCGAIGSAVARTLARHGADLTITDIETSRAGQLADEIDARIGNTATFFDSHAEVYAPCALGGVVTHEVARTLPGHILCGAANNILVDQRSESILRERGITVVPDVIASAGAVVAGIARTVMGIEDPGELIAQLGHITRDILEASENADTLASEIVLQRVRARLQGTSVALLDWDS